jgi:hypothetical protein
MLGISSRCLLMFIEYQIGGRKEIGERQTSPFQEDSRARRVMW